MPRSQQFQVSVPLLPVPRAVVAAYIKQAIEQWAQHLPSFHPLKGNTFRARERSRVSVRPLT